MKVIALNNEARKKLISGVNKVCDATKLTLGPFGFNAILGREYKNPTITNDGVTIAGEIELEDEIENLGAEVIKSVSNNTDKGAGDGTTTSMVLAQKIIEKGFALLSGDNLVQKSAMAIRKEIDEAKDIAIEYLKQLALPVETEEELQNVAFTALENEKLATTLTQVVKEVGKNGLITVEDSEAFETTYRVEKGLEVNSGFISPYMEDKDGEVTLRNVPVLVTNYKLNSIPEISPLTTELAKENLTELVIFADDFSNNVTSTFVFNKMEGVFKVIAIRVRNTDDLRDIALITGAKMVDVLKGDKFENIGLEVLGKAEKAVVDKDKALLVGINADTKDRVAELVVQAEKEKISEYEKQKLLKRISGLDKGVGIIQVGAPSQEEREYIKLKLEDGINAVKSAAEMGVVPGGGVALKMAGALLPNNSILSEVLVAPYKQIQENAGGKLEIPESVIDPLKTTIKALENACSVAGILLTSAIAVAHKNERSAERTPTAE